VLVPLAAPTCVQTPAVHTLAIAAEGWVSALGRGVAGVEALETDDEAGLVDRRRRADGGQVTYRVASLAVIAVSAGDGETVASQIGIAFLHKYALLLLEVLEVLLRALLLVLLLVLLLILSFLLVRLLLLAVVLVVLAVLTILISRIVSRRPLIRRVLTLGIRVRPLSVHVASIMRLGRLRVDLIVSFFGGLDVNVVGIVAGITVVDITITIHIDIRL